MEPWFASSAWGLCEAAPERGPAEKGVPVRGGADFQGRFQLGSGLGTAPGGLAHDSQAPVFSQPSPAFFLIRPFGLVPLGFSPPWTRDTHLL